MSPLREGFDNSSETRCANGVSVDNKLNSYSNDSLKGQNNLNDTENDITRRSNAGTEINSSNDKTQRHDDKIHDSQDDDEKARAFRSQFDEIRCASKMFEYFKNNRPQGLAGRAPSASSQKRINETGINSFHQRSHSHSTYPQQTNRHMLKHQRSASSIQGLSFNGNTSAFKFYPTHGIPTFNPYGFDNTDDLLRHQLHHFDDSNSVNGNDDSFMKFRDLENSGGRLGFNNSRFVSNSDEWDDSSPGYPSTPLSNGPFTPLPLTPTSTYSSLSPSTPYFAQPNSFLDDDELNEKAKRLEEERLLLQIQQRKLEIAAHRLRYHHSDPSLNETEARYKLNNATSPPMMPTRGKTLPTKQTFGIKLTAPPPRFQNSQEPIGTPVKKSGYITPPPTTSTGSSNSSLSMSAPTFSLFSNPPALSFNNNLMNQQQKHHRTISCDNNNSNGRISPLYGFPLTPSSSPPKTSDGYFGFSSFTKPSNVNNNCWANNNENSYPNTLSPTIFTTTSPGYFRAPLYSTPVDEREEDSLFADEYFNNLNNKKDYYTTYSFAIDDRHWLD